jgi:glycosyltransferase involved in cell wall biosynthesis
MNASRGQVAFFVPSMQGGGAERTTLNVAEAIAARGYAVDLVLCRAKGPYLAEIPESVRVVDLGAQRVLLSLPSLMRYLRECEPRAVFSVMHANFVALWAQRLVGSSTRLVVSERNTLSSMQQHYASDPRMWLMPGLIKRFYPWAAGVVAVSRGVADDLARVTRIPRSRVQVIYNPVVTPQLRAKAQAGLEHPWFGPGQPPVVLGAGRLTAQKDFATLIRAFAKLRQALPARLLILGEGEDRATLEALVQQLGLQQDVSLPGFAANPYPYMIRASLFVLSSRWEGLPGVLVEALYCGAPLVSTDCPSGPREILADGRYGRLVPVGDVGAMARAMQAVLGGESVRPPAESWRPFELDVVVGQYIDVLFGD